MIGTREHVERVFKGENLFYKNYKTPLDIRRYKKRKNIIDKIRLQDVTGYPVFDTNQNIKYLVFTSQVTNIYYGNKAIISAQKYMYDNWIDNFNLALIVKNTGLSTSQFIRVFKKHTGKTPYEYYKNIKIEKLKDRLCDPTIKVADAFADCGLDYSGRYKHFLKEIVGITPYEYWKRNNINSNR